MLDEPTSHMDEENATMMLDDRQYLGSRIYVLASNLDREHAGISTKMYLQGLIPSSPTFIFVYL